MHTVADSPVLAAPSIRSLAHERMAGSGNGSHTDAIKRKEGPFSHAGGGSLVFIFLETNFGASGPVAAGSLMIRPRQGQWSEEGETLDPWDITDGRPASHADSLSYSGLPGTRSRKRPRLSPNFLSPAPVVSGTGGCSTRHYHFQLLHPQLLAALQGHPVFLGFLQSVIAHGGAQADHHVHSAKIKRKPKTG